MRLAKPAFTPPTHPMWGDLRPILHTRFIELDHAAFTEWLLGERKLALATMRDSLQKLRRLERDGFQGRVFLQSPDHARAEVRRMRAQLRLAGTPANSIRHSEVVWNRVAEWAASMDRRFEGVRWDLTPEVKGMPKTLEPHQAAAALQYRCPGDEVAEKRRRALIYLEQNLLGWRKSEVEGLEVTHLDLNPDRPRIYMARPAKGRGPMWWPLPRDAVSPNRPLKAWLAVRPVPDERPNALWTFRVRRPKGAVHVGAFKTLSPDVHAICRTLGFRWGFTRSRRYDTQRLDNAGVHPRIIQRKRNHAKLETTMRYAGEVTIERAEKELAGKAPGFKAANRKRKQPGERTARDIIEGELASVEGRQGVNQVAIGEGVPAPDNEGPIARRD